MRRFLKSLLIVILALCAPIFAQEFSSGWVTMPITIDGDGDEWKDLAFTYTDDNKTAIGVKNDTDAVYLMIISRDERTVMQMERSGVAVWLNTNGKKKRDFGVRYIAGRLSDKPRRIEQGRGMPPDMEDRMEDMKARQAHLRAVITVIEDNKSSEIPSRSDLGPSAAASFAKDIYAMEFRIPIVASREEGIGIVLGDKPELVFGLEFGYLTDTEKREMQQRRREREDGGMQVGMGGAGGQGGFDRQGGGPPNGMGMRGEMKKDVWLEIKLADPPDPD